MRAWSRRHVRGHGAGTGLGLRGAGFGLIMQVDRTGVVSQRLIFAMSNESALLWLVPISKSRGCAQAINHVIEALGVCLMGAVFCDAHSDYPYWRRIMPATVVDSGNSQVENYRED